MIKLILLLIVLLLLFFIYISIEQFVNVNIVNDFYVTDIDVNDKNINTPRICIFKRGPSTSSESSESSESSSSTPPSTSTSNLKIIDYECINTNELLPILQLSEYRKKTVCLDGNCLDKNDLKILNGTDTFKISNKSLQSSFKDKCLGGHANVKLRRCGISTEVTSVGPNWPKKWNGQHIKSLNPQSCDTTGAFDYKLEPGLNSDKNLKREDYKFVQESSPEKSHIGIEEGHNVN